MINPINIKEKIINWKCKKVYSFSEKQVLVASYQSEEATQGFSLTNPTLPVLLPNKKGTKSKGSYFN